MATSAAINYKKLTGVEHVLLNNDMYISTIEVTEQPLWVVKEAPAAAGAGSADAPLGTAFEQKLIAFNPGFYKLFDEAIVNAGDHVVRMKQKGGQPVKNIHVSISGDRITVRNDGDGIDIQMSEANHCWVPELIMGQLLTSTNYEKDEKKLTGGKNGYGVKLVNIFATEFSVETVDAKVGKKYKQVWKDNMSSVGKPSITASKVKPYVEISWKPDFARLGYAGAKEVPEDMRRVFEKRTYDLAATVGKEVKVYWNGAHIKINKFADYAAMYLPTDAPSVSLSLNDRWDIVVADNPLKKFMHVSFVNGIWTPLGGTHVNAVSTQVVKHLSELVTKKHKGAAEVSEALVENNLAVFVRCMIENPSFNSQTKEMLKTRPREFGSSCDIPEADLKKIASKLAIVGRLMEGMDAKEAKDAKKTDGRKTSTIRGIPKLDDAAAAGTRESAKCTLILTEGDSAKSMALSGLSQAQRKYYGVFPLRGKVMNVKDSAAGKVHANEEIAALKKILGLETGKTYKDASALRYGRICIMTDQDADGSHIRGLLVNLFHGLWASLLEVPGFVTYMATPIVKATKGKDSKTFYTLYEYEQWKATDASRGYAVKYYKGLGTSNRTEAQEYFKAIDTTTVKFAWSGKDSNEAIDMAFNKARADDRKDWLRTYEKSEVLKSSVRSLPYEEFVHKDLKHFSYYDLVRSIPHVMDGLKVSQRKILYAAFKRNLTKEIRVAQFAGYVSEHTGYHHGEASLNAAIIGMAQDFVGSNNINLLAPNGQFGTRLQGGHDAASPRYIHTELAKLTPLLFPKADFPVLSYEDDDGTPVEPTFYAPILPMVLINGADGIGTGFSTKVLQYNPKDILQEVRRRLNGSATGSSFSPLPWYRGFTGKVDADGSFHGKWAYVGGSKTSILITELPVGTWTASYKEFLEEQIEKKDAFVADYKDSSTDLKVHFEVTLRKPFDKDEEVPKALHLVTKKSTKNMHLFVPTDKGANLENFETVEAILQTFMKVRLDLYEKRKAYLLAALEREAARHGSIMAFLQAQLDGKLDLRRKSKEAVEAELKALKIAADPEGSYAFLLRMPFSSITAEELEKHRRELEEARRGLALLTSMTPTQLWLDDLAAFEAEYAKTAVA